MRTYTDGLFALMVWQSELAGQAQVAAMVARRAGDRIAATAARRAMARHERLESRAMAALLRRGANVARTGAPGLKAEADRLLLGGSR